MQFIQRFLLLFHFFDFTGGGFFSSGAIGDATRNSKGGTSFIGGGRGGAGYVVTTTPASPFVVKMRYYTYGDGGFGMLTYLSYNHPREQFLLTLLISSLRQAAVGQHLVQMLYEEEVEEATLV